MTITCFRIMVCMIFVVLLPTIKAEPTTVESPNDEIKCGTCPCGTTCYSSPPPPSPSPPPPPPPPKKQTPTNCPPPPYTGGGKAPPTYIYITGPPGDLYPVVQSAASSCGFRMAALLLVVTSGLLQASFLIW